MKRTIILLLALTWASLVLLSWREAPLPQETTASDSSRAEEGFKHAGPDSFPAG